MVRRKDFFSDALHILVLFSFAVAQPLFDILSKHVEFFVVRKSEPLDIILLIGFLCLCLPLVAILIQAAAGLLGRRLRKAIHCSMVWVLLAVIALQILKKILEAPGIPLIITAGVFGGIGTAVYVRFRRMRTYLTALSPAVLIFPALFLFNSPVYKVVFPRKEPSAIQLKIDDPPPIIWVVFDEFPLASLLDEHDQIDSVLYPNFAALSRDAYWFRNATTVAAQTTLILPSMVTGNYPKSYLQPVAADYPQNVFTLLGESHELRVFESQTQLCPEELCKEEMTPRAFEERMVPLFSDLSVVYLHLLLPQDLSERLPVITQTWKDFVRPTSEPRGTKNRRLSKKGVLQKLTLEILRSNRRDEFLRFVDSIEAGGHPSFYFVHTMLPHRPWEFLPSGKQYNAPRSAGFKFDGTKGAEIWGDDHWTVKQAYQRHLLQVRLVDALLGELIEKLKANGLYERSLLIITADHGISFRPTDYLRVVTRSNAGDIMCIPLFIKAPNQLEGKTFDRKAESIDILPTMADILGIEIPWEMDGRSLLDETDRGASEIVLTNPRKEKLRFMAKSIYELRREAQRWKQDVFGPITTVDKLYSIGPHRELIGQPIHDIDLRTGDTVVQLDQDDFYENVDLKAAVLPCMVSGRLYIKKQKMEEKEINLAVAINGVICTTTLVFPMQAGIAEWTSLVPENLFQPGPNDVEVFRILEGVGGVILETTINQSKPVYAFSKSKGSEGKEFILADGRSIPIVKGAVRGHVSVLDFRGGRAILEGWAADVSNSKLPQAIVIFDEEKFVYSGRCNALRPDVAMAFGNNQALLRAGFRYVLPVSYFKDPIKANIRVFAVSQEGPASELEYPSKPAPAEGPVEDSVCLVRSEGDTKTVYSLHPKDDCCEQGGSGKASCIRVIPGAVDGNLEVARVVDGHVVLRGWAADAENSETVEAVVVFLNGDYFYSGKCTLERPDVAKHFGNDALMKSGYKFSFPISEFENLPESNLRIFAVSKRGLASEFRVGRIKSVVSFSKPAQEGGAALWVIPGSADSPDTYFLSKPHETKADFGAMVRIPIITNGMKGHLDIARTEGDSVIFSGWAADIENTELPDAIVLFVNQKCFYVGQCNLDRPDVAKAYDNPVLVKSGFRYSFPLSSFKNRDDAEVRIFQISKRGTAAELIYPKGYRLGSG